MADIEQGRRKEDVSGLAGLEIHTDTAAVTVYRVGNHPRPPGRGRTAARGHRPPAAGPALEGTGITVEWTADNAEKGPSAERMTALAGMPVSTEISEPAAPT